MAEAIADRDDVPVTVKRILCLSSTPSIDRVMAVERLLPGGVMRPELLSV